MNNFFVDSCVFFAFAYPEEKWNSKTTIFFNSAFDRFTGVRVKTEIERRLQKRKELYKRLASFFSNGGKVADFDTSSITNHNDQQHFAKLLLILTSRSPSEVLEYFRDKDNATGIGIREAFGRIQMPLVGRTYDPVCEDIILALVNNRSDAQIFIDAYSWSERKGASTFATTDVNDFVRNRDDIHRAMRNYKLLNRSEDLPLKISHIDEII